MKIGEDSARAFLVTSGGQEVGTGSSRCLSLSQDEVRFSRFRSLVRPCQRNRGLSVIAPCSFVSCLVQFPVVFPFLCLFFVRSFRGYSGCSRPEERNSLVTHDMDRGSLCGRQQSYY